MALPQGAPRTLKRLWAFLDKRETATTALTSIATANATDEATAIALANECKAKINAIITALKV